MLYTSDVFDLADLHGFHVHGYADDLQLYDHCLPCDTDILSKRFSNCVDDIREWMSSNRLRLNSSKTEVIWLGSRQRVKVLESGRMKISGVEIQTSGHIRNLGVIMDASLTFSDHVSKLVRTSYYHLRQLRGIRRSLTTDSCHSLVRALIHSRIDYCNGLMSGISLQLLDQLDGVMRAAARLILQLPRMSSITSAIRQRLHWLDVGRRIRFKLCVLAYRCLHGTAPVYLSRYIVPVSSVVGRSNLRSASSGLLCVPASKTVFGSRSFAISCPSAWNSLPSDIRRTDLSLLNFRKKLKTYLFSDSIWDINNYFVMFFTICRLLLAGALWTAWEHFNIHNNNKIQYSLGSRNGTLLTIPYDSDSNWICHKVVWHRG